MVEITQYKCLDGKIFSNREDARKYEDLIYRVTNLIEEKLGDEPRSGEGKAHNPQLIREALAIFMQICSETIPNHKDKFSKITLDNLNCYCLYHVLSDYSSDYPILWITYYRFRCIDKETFIEYETPSSFSPEEQSQNE